MPEPFKNKFSLELVQLLALKIHEQYTEFNQNAFVQAATFDFNELELKQRSQQITGALHQFMPDSFQRCETIIREILHPAEIDSMNEAIVEQEGIRGWLIMPLADLVSIRAIPDHFEAGLNLLKVLTSRFSSEFALRDFILFDQQRALDIIMNWPKSGDKHIRRLASEGTRPRLPWGKQLPEFIAQPDLIRPLLVNLLNDNEEYVRRSVANNLNDIAKDNAEFVCEFVAEYLPDADQTRLRLLKHASRTLFKQGHPKILALFGYTPFQGSVQFRLAQKQVAMESALSMQVELHGLAVGNQKLMVDYIVWHKKANGTQSAKVFKWKQLESYRGDAISLKKQHSFKSVTTRKYYPGEHRIALQINGQVLSEVTFELIAGK